MNGIIRHKSAIIKTLITFVLLAFQTTHSFSSSIEKDPSSTKHSALSNVKPNHNEAIIKIHGVVCSFCSYGVQKKLSKFDFIDKSKYNKGSRVIASEQKVLVAINPSALITPEDMDLIFNAIRSGGYDPIEAYYWGSDDSVVRHTSIL